MTNSAHKKFAAAVRNKRTVPLPPEELAALENYFYTKMNILRAQAVMNATVDWDKVNKLNIYTKSAPASLKLYAASVS